MEAQTLKYMLDSHKTAEVSLVLPGGEWRAQRSMDEDELRQLSESFNAAIRTNDRKAMRQHSELLTQKLLPPTILDNLPHDGVLRVESNSPALQRVLTRAAGLIKENYMLSTSPLFSALLMENDTEIDSALRKMNIDQNLIVSAIALVFNTSIVPSVKAVPPREIWSENALSALTLAETAVESQGRDSVTPKDLFIALLSMPCMLTSLLTRLGVDCGQLIATLRSMEI